MPRFVTTVILAAVLAVLPASGATAQTTLQEIAGQFLSEPGVTTICVAREFITMAPEEPRAEAVAVRDGRFAAVGTRAEVEAAAGGSARVDTTFADKVAIAGVVERHVHPVLAALTMNSRVISIEDWDAKDIAVWGTMPQGRVQTAPDISSTEGEKPVRAARAADVPGSAGRGVVAGGGHGHGDEPRRIARAPAAAMTAQASATR